MAVRNSLSLIALPVYNPGRNMEASLVFNNYPAFAFLTLNFPCTNTGSATPQLHFFLGLTLIYWRIGLVGVFHITSLTSNNISSAIDPYSSWIPWIDTFQVINHNCNLVIFQNISEFCGFKKVHSAYI